MSVTLAHKRYKYLWKLVGHRILGALIKILAIMLEALWPLVLVQGLGFRA